MGMRKVQLGLMAILAAAPLTVLAHQEATGIVGERMMGMMEMGKAMRSIQGQVGAGNFDEAQENTQAMQTHAQEIVTLFAQEEYGQGSDASPTIWTDPEGFSAASDKLTMALADLANALESQDGDSAQAALRNVGASCGQCHSVYRSKTN